MASVLTRKDESRAAALKRATAAALRAMGQARGVIVDYGRATEKPSLGPDAAHLPDPGAKPSVDDVRLLRGHADTLAVRLHYHDRKLHARLRPSGEDAREAFNALEQVRIETLGLRAYPGSAQNLAAVHRLTAENYTGIRERRREDLGHALALLARERLGGPALPAPARALANLWRDWLAGAAPGYLERLAGAVDDQEAFAAATGEILRALDLMDDAPGQSEEDQQSEQDASQGDDAEQGGEGEQRDAPPEEREAAPTSSLTAMLAEAMQAGDSMDGDMVGDGESPAGPTERPADWPSNEPPAKAPYRAFLTKYDEVIPAEDLADGGELARLREQLDRQLDKLQGVVAKLANRLQRRLLAKQTRSWEFDLEDGLLDVARLARVVVDPHSPLSFKMEKDADFRDTVVTLLIDNSGSMRGRPITIAAIGADVMARTLERCGVKVEILGFTTRAWKGGKAREAWVAAGKPERPGRLNDLRHIVYKSADAPWRRARRNLGLMLKEGILKENIDGEALRWAYSRLMARPEQRRILMVISDGAPVDDATLSANPGNYLERDLREVIEQIENRSSVELIAIGIGHDVTRYYRRAVTLLDAEHLGGAIMNELADLFDEDTRSRRTRR
ncbi:MAG: cobaltochelatase subunit CobT [Alphaproteobacteria bacterium]|nr:cobaltochelatase subunit CobT [Alphaproteobacteria bacterium]